MANACSLTNRKNPAAYTDALAEDYAQQVGVDPRPNEVKDELDERGAFVRQTNIFTRPFGEGKDDLKAEEGRYAIYWMHGCHWSNRPVIARDILGLKDVIKDVATTHTGESNVYGHGFADQKDFKDPYCGAYFLSEFYKRVKPDFKGRATTPTLVDVNEKTAVNNDYHRLSNYIEVQFRKFQPEDAPDLYPVKYRKEIDEFNDWLFPTVNNGHYRMAFCQSWEAYNEAYEDFYDSLEKLDKRLSENRFLFGDYITDSDIRLYVTLVRWETSYYRNVGPTKKRLTEYPNIWGYVKELFSLPDFRRYTFFEFPTTDSKEFFVNYAARIASQVPYDELWKSDGARKSLSEDPEHVYKKHPAGETPEQYQSAISPSKWNSEDPKQRDSNLRTISQDPSVNPIASKLRD